MARIKLSWEKVEKIRILCEFTALTDSQIAHIFDVSRKHINAIRHKKRWNYEWKD
jgi:hypothetical protein